MTANRKPLCRLVTATALITAAVSGQTVLYVDDDAPPGGDGLAWETAYRFLQDALAEATSDGAVAEVHVAQGVYTPDRDEANPNAPSSSNCCVSHSGPGCDDLTCEASVCATDPFCCANYWDFDCADLAVQLCGELDCPDREASFRLVSVQVQSCRAGVSYAKGGQRP